MKEKLKSRLSGKTLLARCHLVLLAFAIAWFAAVVVTFTWACVDIKNIIAACGGDEPCFATLLGARKPLLDQALNFVVAVTNAFFVASVMLFSCRYNGIVRVTVTDIVDEFIGIIMNWKKNAEGNDHGKHLLRHR
jgi:hypothetical protein